MCPPFLFTVLIALYLLWRAEAQVRPYCHKGIAVIPANAGIQGFCLLSFFFSRRSMDAKE